MIIVENTPHQHSKLCYITGHQDIRHHTNHAGLIIDAVFILEGSAMSIQKKNTAQLILTSESVSGALLVDATTRAAMLSFSTPLARELRRALSPGFLCCRNSDVTVVIRRKVVGIDLHIWLPEKFYNSVTLFAVRPIMLIIA